MTTLKTSLKNNNIPSLEHLPWLSGKQGFQNHLINDWLQPVASTVQYVSVTFREHGHPNPTLNEDRQLAYILQQEFRLFKNLDPAEKHQAAIPISVISKINKHNSSVLEWAITQLFTFSIFFVVHLCEYLKVHQPKQWCMEIIRLVTSISSRELNSSAMTIPN